MKKTMTVLLLLAAAVSASAVPLRVMSWNIQDGMWDGQGDDYARFVAYVKEKAPDVCVWTEAESLLKTGKCEDLPSEERFLPKGWPALAARYGHRYVYLAEHRDNYPQVITSRFPIDNVKRISGRKDNPVCHGAGWATITVAGHKINLVTFHAWPLGWKFDCWNPEERRKESIAAHGGDFQRRDEIEQVCTETILGRSAETGDLWLMAGDFNAGARTDNAWYRLPEDDPSFMLHDWIAEHTPYVDIVKRMHPDIFTPSVFNDRPGYGYKGSRRIDFVYLTPELARHAVSADVIKDDYACSVRDAAKLGVNLRHPSDHLPVIVDFNLPDRDGGGNVLFRFDGEIGAKTGWRLVQQEKGKVVYIPFEGYYESKGGRVESAKFDLGGARYARLVFSARAKADGYWWVDQFDVGGRSLPDINSRIYASSGWNDYEVMVPLSGAAVTGQVAFVSEKGVDVRDVRLEGVDATTVADWCDILYATLPQIEAGDLSAAWAKLPRSRERLLSGKPLRVVLLGDSIVNDTYCGNAAALVQREFPNVEFVLSVRGSTGCWYYRDPKHFEEYVMRHKPDLVLVGGISNGKNNADYSTAEEDMVAVIELALKSGIEVAVMSPPPSYEWRKTPEQTDWDENFVFTHYDIYAKGLKNWQPLRRDYQRAATEKTGVAYWDLTTAPCNAISRSRKPLNWFHRDVCHNDDRGKQLIARTFAAYFNAASVPVAPVRVAPGAGYSYRAYCPGAVRPMGFLVEFVRRQAEGTLSHRHEAKYPFDQELWAQPITNLHWASPMWRAPDRPYSEDEKMRAWVPYEQTGYMLDGMARLSFLMDAPTVRADYEKSLWSVIANADPDGRLGRWYDNRDHMLEWPFLIFARSAFAYFEGTDDRRVLDALARHYDAFGEGRLAWRGREMFNAEMLLLLYEYTGDRKLVDDAVRMVSGSDIWSRFKTEKRILEHGVTFAEALKLPAILTLITGDRGWLGLGEKALDNAFELNEQPDGMISANEFLSGRDPRQGHEACVVSDLIWTLGYYLQADGRAIDADRMERIAYNALPGHMTKDFRRYQYLSFVNQAQVTPFSSPTHFAPRAKHHQYRPNLFFECCLGNIQRALPNFILRMWMREEGTGAPVAMLHGPSMLKSEYKGVGFAIEEQTDYPFSDRIRFVVHVDHPVEMPLKYRVPSWAKRPDAGTIACETRIWKDGDVFETTFPSEVELKSDRNWHWFAKGALSFAYPVPTDVAEERPGDPYSPLILTPNGPWNWAIDPIALKSAMPVAEYRENGRFPYDESPLVLKVPVKGLQEWRVFDSGKWMPDPPLFAHPSGETATLTLVPEGATLARVTAFPDVTSRKEFPVPCAFLYDGKRYDYDPKIPLAEQKGGPETDSEFSFDFLMKDDPPQRGLDDFYDLGNRFGTTKNSFAYLVFAVWSDRAGKATAALAAAHTWQVFQNGREVAHNVGIQEGRYMMPEWFEIDVKPGYNWLVVKVATPGWVATYRREWGAKLQVFADDDAD